MILLSIYQELDRVKRLMTYIQGRVGTFPEGRLRCTHNGDYLKYFLSDGHTNHYLCRKERPLAQALAAKEYYRRLEAKAMHLQKLIDYYQKHIEQDEAQLRALFDEQAGFEPLLKPLMTIKETPYEAWAKAPYAKNPFYPQHLKFKTKSGLYVRSKSEMIIADILQENRIPFRYECALTLGAQTLYPDFTIKHPATGEIYYLEHFGLLDDAAYRARTFQKLEIYLQHHCYNLLITWETQEQPLTVEQVNAALAPIVQPYAQAS